MTDETQKNDLGELSFEEAIEQETARIKGETERMIKDPTFQSVNHRRYAYITRGYYSDQLERWLALFPPLHGSGSA